jgi:hypothetical protein
MLFQLFIVNRSGNFLNLSLILIDFVGGLIYNKNLSLAAPNISTNDSLRLGSTFHGLHAITTQIAPIVCLGIENLETDTFTLQCFQTLTGIKFFVTASPGTQDLEGFLRGVYDLYADYVLKVGYIVIVLPLLISTQNPFYEMEMPIRCDLFNKNLDRTVQRVTALQNRKKTVA